MANGNLGEAYVEVRAKTDGFAKDVTKGVTEGLDKAQKVADGVGSSAESAFTRASTVATSFTRKAAIPAALALGGVFAGLKNAALAASDLNEETSKSNVIFGESAKQVQEFAKTASESFGQSRVQALQAASNFAMFGKSAGLAGDDLVKFSKDFTVLASDLASFNNTTPEEAINAIGAALRGESEPIRRYNVLLNDATLKATALKLGLIETEKEALTPQQRVLAATEEIFKQTSQAQGDFARTSEGAANQSRILASRLADARIELGQSFQPVLEKVLGVLVTATGFFKDNSDAVAAGAVAIGAFATAILIANTAIAAWRTIATITAGLNYVLATSFTAVQVATGVGIATAIAGAAAFVAIKGKYEDARKEADKLTSSTQQLTGALVDQTYGLSQAEYALATYIGPLNAAQAAERKRLYELLETRKAEEAATKAKAANAAASAEAARKADELKNKIRQLRDAFGRDFETTMERAQTVLGNAKQAFNDFATDVSRSLTNAFSFGQAFDEQAQANADLTEAIKRRTEAEQELAEARKGDDPKKIADAAREVELAIARVNEVGNKPLSFFAQLEVEAAKVRTFGELVNRLIAAGLSEGALQQVLAAGTESGTKIAQEILGSADGVLKANTLAADVASIGTQVGTQAATTFRQAGVDAATALVQGVDSILANYRVKLKSKALTPKQLRKLQKQFAIDVEFAFSGGAGVPELANGGIVDRPQLAMIGEAGREAVVPITRPARALQIMEQTGLASLARNNQGAVVSIAQATFVAPTDADLLAQKVLAAEKARTFNA